MLKKEVIISPGYVPAGAARLTGYSIIDAFSVVFSNRVVLLAMTKRDLLSRFRGSILGRAWIVLLPMVMMAVYSGVFSVGMGLRFPGVNGLAGSVLATWFSLVIWQFIAESVNRCVSVLHDNAPFVKRIPFPVAILPAVMMLSAASNALASGALFALAYLCVGPGFSWSVFGVFAVVMPVALGLHGLLWMITAAGGVVRDLKHIVPVLLTLVMFATPVVWPLSAVSPRFQEVLSLNPLVWVFETLRASIFGMPLPSLASFGLAMAAGFTLNVCGYAVFRIAEKEMRDVV